MVLSNEVSPPRPLKTFKDVLQGNASPDIIDIKYDHGIFLGTPALFISNEDMVTLAKPFEITLVGKFATSRPPLASIQKFIARMKFSGNVLVDVHDNLNVIFRFAEEGDYNRFFHHRYYTVFGVTMKVIKWSPFVDISEELPIVPLWLTFPGLRLQLFDKTTLLFLGKMFGKPLSIDASTAACGNMSKARILVEVDVTKPIPNKIWIGSTESGFFQSVVVENKPLYCDQYKIFGHEGSYCSVNLRNASVNDHIPGAMEGSVSMSNPPRDTTLLITMGNKEVEELTGLPRIAPIPSVMESCEPQVVPANTVDGEFMIEDELCNNHTVGIVKGAGVAVMQDNPEEISEDHPDGPSSFHVLNDSFSPGRLKLGNSVEINTKKLNRKVDDSEDQVNTMRANPLLVGEILKELRNVTDPTKMGEADKLGEDNGNKNTKEAEDLQDFDNGRESSDENIHLSPKLAHDGDEKLVLNNPLMYGYPSSG